jgi:predicted metallo-beta-lactamase superfamily hydrolase
VTIKFSEPVPHGLANEDQGYLLMTSIDDGTKKIIHCSDVAGPTERRTAEIIVFEKPDLIILSGPPTHEWYLSKMIMEKAKDNMRYIIEKSGAKEIILDHHSMRDLDYKTNLADIFALAEQIGVKIINAAEYAGQPVRQLEAKRNQLWEREQTEQNY